MRQWIGLIIIALAGYYLWTQFGAELGPQKVEPATPNVEWYLKEVEHHFSIVRERGDAYFFRGFHENETTRTLLGVRAKVFLREGGDWRVLDTYELGMLEPEQRRTFDNPIRVPRGLDKPKLRWEIVEVRTR